MTNAPIKSNDTLVIGEPKLVRLPADLQKQANDLGELAKLSCSVIPADAGIQTSESGH